MGGMTFGQVEETWIKAGGNPQAAAMAAAVADASSGLNPDASNQNPDGTTSRGLWQVSSALGALSTTDPLANARAAIQMSNNGTDWSGWCSTWSDNNCGLNNGTYLGEGANALASLAGKLGMASYNVAGAKPTTGGYSASSTVANSTSPTGGSGKWGIILLAIVGLGGAIFYAQRHSRPTVASAPIRPR